MRMRAIIINFSFTLSKADEGSRPETFCLLFHAMYVAHEH